MTIIYEIKYWDLSIKLFDQNFVMNNINNCYLLISGKQIKLCKELTLDQNQKNRKFWK